MRATLVWSQNPQTQDMIKNPRQKDCEICHTELKFKYQFSNKIRIYLNGPKRVKRNSFRCLTQDCPNYDEAITAASENVKHHRFTYEVLLVIALLRIDEKMTQKQVVLYLKRTYNLYISESQIGQVVKKYLKLVGNRPTEIILKQLRKRGKIVLDIDGVKPEKGNHVLYLIRDLLSGRILLARTLEVSNKEALGDLFKEIKSMGLDVIGIVSDKQKAIITGAAQEFPAIPHQFCQYHFLKNISDDFAETDRNLRKELRKRMTPLTRTLKTTQRQLERGAITLMQYQALHRFYEALRHIKSKTAKYPFKVIGITLYEDLVKFENRLRKMAKGLDLAQFQTMLKHISRIKSDFGFKYQVLKEQFYQLLRINELLVGGLSRKASERALLNYVHLHLRLARRKRATKVSAALIEWWEAVVRMTEAWVPGLFAFLDEESLPRTNNLMEQYIKKVKYSLRFAGNKQLVHRFLLRRGEFWVFGQELLHLGENEALKLLKETKGEVNLENGQRLDYLESNFQVERRCLYNLEDELDEILTDWMEVC